MILIATVSKPGIAALLEVTARVFLFLAPGSYFDWKMSADLL